MTTPPAARVARCQWHFWASSRPSDEGPWSRYFAATAAAPFHTASIKTAPVGGLFRLSTRSYVPDGTFRKCRATPTMSVDSGKADPAIGRLMNLTRPFKSKREKAKRPPEGGLFVGASALKIRLAECCGVLATAISSLPRWRALARLRRCRAGRRRYCYHPRLKATADRHLGGSDDHLVEATKGSSDGAFY